MHPFPCQRPVPAPSPARPTAPFPLVCGCHPPLFHYSTNPFKMEGVFQKNIGFYSKTGKTTPDKKSCDKNAAQSSRLVLRPVSFPGASLTCDPALSHVQNVAKNFHFWRCRLRPIPHSKWSKIEMSFQTGGKMTEFCPAGE